MKRYLLVTAIVLVSAGPAAGGMTDFGKDVCADDPKTTQHCDCVGKTAYHKGPTAELPVGKVIGVVWKNKGSCRSKNCQVLAPRDGYYLVVRDSMGQLTKDPRETSCK
jgi:hypothetical protein